MRSLGLIPLFLFSCTETALFVNQQPVEFDYSFNSIVIRVNNKYGISFDTGSALTEAYPEIYQVSSSQYLGFRFENQILWNGQIVRGFFPLYQFSIATDDFSVRFISSTIDPQLKPGATTSFFGSEDIYKISVLGYDNIKNMNFVVDYLKATITNGTINNPEFRYLLDYSDGVPSISLHIGDFETHAVLDTGSPISFISRNTLKKLKQSSYQHIKILELPDVQEFEDEFIITDVKIGHIILNTAFMVRDHGTVTIGNEILSHFIIGLNNAQGTLDLISASDLKPAFRETLPISTYFFRKNINTNLMTINIANLTNESDNINYADIIEAKLNSDSLELRQEDLTLTEFSNHHYLYKIIRNYSRLPFTPKRVLKILSDLAFKNDLH